MDPAIQNISQQTEVPVPPAPHRSKKFSFVIVTLFVLFVIGAFFGGMYYKGLSKEASSVVVPTPVPTESETAAINTLNWKTYAEGGVSLSYPTEWYEGETFGEGDASGSYFSSKAFSNYPYTGDGTFGSDFSDKPDYLIFGLGYIFKPEYKSKTAEDLIHQDEKDNPNFVYESKGIVSAHGNQFHILLDHKKESTSYTLDAVMVKEGARYDLTLSAKSLDVILKWNGIFEQIVKSFVLSTVTPTIGKTKVPKEQTADWKTYNNSKYGFSLKYPATGEVEDPSCLGTATCSKHISACGADIQEKYNQNPPEITFDNWFAISIVPFNGSIVQFMVQKGAEGKYETKTVSVSGADEALKISGIKSGTTIEGYDPLNDISYLVRKGKIIFEVVGFQAIASTGCLPEVSTSLPADYMPNWDIAESLSFN